MTYTYTHIYIWYILSYIEQNGMKNGLPKSYIN